MPQIFLSKYEVYRLNQSLGPNNSVLSVYSVISIDKNPTVILVDFDSRLKYIYMEALMIGD